VKDAVVQATIKLRNLELVPRAISVSISIQLAAITLPLEAITAHNYTQVIGQCLLITEKVFQKDFHGIHQSTRHNHHASENERAG
jgi:hypothetical protein